ncbi:MULTISPECIES: hypothetical protein [Streptomyces]|uniref:hypothetical protein n=1 Tax=Streptomyces TaxID=1883 RepID=UPI0023DD3548|nr:hypothetical protein [Streptomyces sp. FXJ1.172]WEP00548.1 hypothetical protein A6P39_043185 [Streptomyces sp. FXJ1.172]
MSASPAPTTRGDTNGVHERLVPGCRAAVLALQSSHPRAYVWPHFRCGASIDPDLTGYRDGAYHVMDDDTLNLGCNGRLKKVATGWGQFNVVFSPGTLGGAAPPDLPARDKQGVLWLYKGTGDLRAPFGPA